MQIPDFMVHLKKKYIFVIFHHNVITCLQPSFLVNITKAPVTRDILQSVKKDCVMPYIFLLVLIPYMNCKSIIRMILSVHISSFNFHFHQLYIHKYKPPHVEDTFTWYLSYCSCWVACLRYWAAYVPALSLRLGSQLQTGWREAGLPGRPFKSEEEELLSGYLLVSGAGTIWGNWDWLDVIFLLQI